VNSRSSEANQDHPSSRLRSGRKSESSRIKTSEELWEININFIRG
jgi:hypothetical protein